jgi:C1A family cysteine protease
MRGLSGLVAFFVVTVCLGTQVPAQDDAVPSPSETQRVSKSLESEDAQMPNDLERLGKFYQERFATAPEAARSQLEAIQRKAVEENWTFQPAYTSAFGRDISKMTGLKIPPNAKERAIRQNEFAAEARAALRAQPAAPLCSATDRKFNLRSLGKVSPVVDQGNCGSCWAFTAIATYESNYLLRGGGGPNASEQHVLDCAIYPADQIEAGSCNGGWYDPVFNWMMETPVTTRRAAPYEAIKNSTCRFRNGQYQSINWGYVDPENWSETWQVPDASLKQAMCEHGPLAIAVNATDEWFVYGGGVYNINAPADQPINHAVTLVGWDDDLGAWLIKNSWNKDWGDGGFMWIKYGTSKVGTAPAWVEVLLGQPNADVMAVTRRYKDIFGDEKASGE